MELFAVEGNRQRLDGGAMFGNAPRELWKRWMTPDDLNRIPLATRCLLLITDDGKKVLFETGTGVFFEPKLRERYGIQESEHMLVKNLANLGVKPEDIDTIILSHLHFDHAGGLLSAYEDGDLRILFTNATIYVGKEHWERAQNPHFRERASFIPQLHQLLKQSDQLRLVEGKEHPDLTFGVEFRYVSGHTVGLMMSTLTGTPIPLTFVGDLIPGNPWMHLPITMGYDRFPELVVQEKKTFLVEMLEKQGALFFTHDPNISCVKVCQNEKKKFYGEEIDLKDLFSV